MSQRTTRRFGFVLLFLSLAVLAFGVWNMQDRLADRELDMVFFEEPMHLEAFRFKGQLVRMELVPPGETGDVSGVPATVLGDDDALGAQTDQRPQLPAVGDDTWVIRYHFRDEFVDFPIFDTADARLFPDAGDADRLGLLDDWFGVYPMVTGARTAQEAADRTATGDLEPRLIVAGRYEPAGVKPGWAQTQRQNWIYRLAELNLNGEPAIEVVERTYRELDAIGTPGTRTPEELIPTPAERERDLWMYYAMQQVTPAPFYRAKDRRLDDALEAMGWTWPVSLGGGFGAVFSIVLIGFGFKARELPA